jgi:hypothetical protein
MKKTKPYTQVKLLCSNILGHNPKYKFKFVFGVTCILFGLLSKAQNLVPNPGFEQFFFNDNNYNNIPGAIPFWSSVAGCEWLHSNNINPMTGNNCGFQYCTTVPKNLAGNQYPNNGSGYAGFYSYKRNSFSNREMLYVPLIDTLEINKQYCVSFYVSLADTANYAHSLLSALFIKDTVHLFDKVISDWQNWTNYFAPQVTNNSGFLSSKTNWMKVEGSFVADSAYKYMVIGLFTNVVLHDTMYVAGGMANFGNPFGYYYVDDVSVTAIDEPVNAALTDTLVTTDTSIVQLGNNSNINATYVWWPADNLSNVNSPNPSLNVIQSGWYYVQKTQCSYFTYDSVYVKANPTGLKGFADYNKKFKLYPNPNNGKFTLQHLSNETSTGTLIVSDVLGNTLLQMPFANRAEIKIDNTNCKGIYFIKVINEDNKIIYIGKAIVN